MLSTFFILPQTLLLVSLTLPFQDVAYVTPCIGYLETSGAALLCSTSAEDRRNFQK